MAVACFSKLLQLSYIVFFLSFSKQHSTDRVTLITNNFSSSPVSWRILAKKTKRVFPKQKTMLESFHILSSIYQLRTKRFIWTYINRCHLNTILVTFSCFHFNLYHIPLPSTFPVKRYYNSFSGLKPKPVSLFQPPPRQTLLTEWKYSPFILKIVFAGWIAAWIWNWYWGLMASHTRTIYLINPRFCWNTFFYFSTV